MLERFNPANYLAIPSIRVFFLCLLVAVGAYACARKELTELRAKEMIQTHIQQTIGGIGLVPFRGTAVPKLIGEYVGNGTQNPITVREDYLNGDWPIETPRAAIQRLLKAHFVNQITTEELRVPNLTGTYDATYYGDYRNPQQVTSTLTVTLRMQKGSPSLSGTASGRSSCNWQIAGQVGKDRAVLKIVSSTGGGIPPCWAYLGIDPPGAAPRVLLISRSGGTTTLTQVDRNVYSSGGPIDLRGRSDNPDITWPFYIYVFDQKFTSQLTENGRLKAGPVEILEVNQLLLGPTETMAHAKFKWRIKLMPAAQALAGKPIAEGVGEVAFGKKPNGDWIVTDMSPNFGELTQDVKSPQAFQVPQVPPLPQEQQTQEPQVPPYTARVSDLTSSLSSDERATLEGKLAAFETRNGAQIAVLIVPTTQPETIEQYATRVVEAWKLGRKDINDGVLVLVAKNDHRLRIAVGTGLEGAISNATAVRIIKEIIAPKFVSGNFSSGIFDGVTAIIAQIEGKGVASPN